MGSDMENLRRQSNMVRIGTVDSVDAAAGTCRVKSGDLTTTDIHWIVPGAGSFIVWSAPRVGEQGLLICPEGEPEGAIFLRGLYSSQFPAPRDREDTVLVRFADGAEIEYDEAAHALSATLPAGGTAALTADGGITLNGPLTVNGETQLNGNTRIDGDAGITGTVTADTDVVGGGISLKNHTHPGVQAGSAKTGKPT